jgi:acylphosphatase
MAKTVVRQEVFYTGRVQGVGFRYTTRQIAQGFEVTGQVKNLPDGRVHLIAEGDEAELQSFLGEIQAQMHHHIKETETHVLAGPAVFRDFIIG